MPDVGAVVNNVSDTAGSFFSRIGDLIQATNLPDQVKDVDFVGLFTNPWLMVPFVAWVIYLVYKQKFKDMILIGIIIAIWWVSGTWSTCRLWWLAMSCRLTRYCRCCLVVLQYLDL